MQPNGLVFQFALVWQAVLPECMFIISEQKRIFSDFELYYESILRLQIEIYNCIYNLSNLYINKVSIIIIINYRQFTIFFRRKPKSTPEGFASKLYQQRPTSAIPLNGEINGQPHAVWHPLILWERQQHKFWQKRLMILLEDWFWIREPWLSECPLRKENKELQSLYFVWW